MKQTHLIVKDEINLTAEPKTKAEILAITNAQQYDGYHCSELNNKIFYWIDGAWFPNSSELD